MAEEGQPGRQEDGRREPGQHRDAAEVRDGHLVNVAVADLRKRAEPHRELAREHGQQIGHGESRDEDEEVLAHQSGSATSRLPTTARRASRSMTPWRRTIRTSVVASTIVD